MCSFKSLSLFAAVSALTVVQAQSGVARTTRYWDCCKESCGWSGKASVSAPVKSCDKNNNPLSNFSVKSSCDGGSAYACSSHSPFAVNSTYSLGFAAVRLKSGSESTWCCQCYQLTFTSGPVQGMKMTVQATSAGGDLGTDHFDIMIPGGGRGLFGQGCPSQYGASSGGWASQYGGVLSQSECSQLPSALQAGCNWRFTWFRNADNPSVSFQQVSCPSKLTSTSGCSRK